MNLCIADIEANALEVRNVTKVHCIVVYTYHDNTYHRFGPNKINAAIRLMEQHKYCVFHNGMFYDVPVLKKLYDYQPQEIVDTSLWSRMVYPDVYTNPVKGHSLENWGKYLKEYKGEYTGGWDEFSREMLDYCQQDVVVTKKLFEYLKPRVKPMQLASKLEHKVADLICEQCLNGVGFRTERAKRLIDRCRRLQEKITIQLQESFPPEVEEMKSPEYWTGKEPQYNGDGGIDGYVSKKYRTKGEARKAGCREADIIRGPNHKKYHPFEPGSRNQIAKRLKEKYNWKHTQETDGGKPQIDEKVLSKLSYPEAPLISRYFMLDKRIGMIQSWLDYEEDGIIYGSMFTIGCVTSRMSHSKPNLGQVPKIAKRGPDYKPLGRSCRSLFKPTRPGWVMFGADLSGLELRFLAHRLYRWDKGKFAKMVLEGDVHSMVRDIVNEFFDEKDHITRNNAKTVIYGIVYGAGPKRVSEILHCNMNKAKKVLNELKRRITGLGELINSLKRSAEKSGYIIGLDGRRIPVRHTHAILNTLLQSDGAIVGKLTWVLWNERRKTEEWGMYCHPMLNVHDEQQGEASNLEYAKQAGQALVDCMSEAGKRLKVNVPITGDYDVGRTWKDTH